MEEIQIQLQSATARGHLYPRYDTEADILEVRSALPRDWPYGIDIDGRVIFDIDADFILANFDLLIPKRLWKVLPLSEEPRPSRKADIVFSQASIRHKSFHLPLEVRTNELKSYAYILIGKPDHRMIWVALSESCLALITEERLKGFFVML